MTSLDDFRQQNPAYKDVPDDKLADGLYNKYYTGKIDRAAFNTKLGVKNLSPAEQEMRGQADALHSVAGAVSTVASPLNDAIGAVGRGLKTLTPDLTNAVEKGVGAAGKAIGDSSVGQYVGQKIKEHPMAAQVAGDVASIAGNVPIMGAEGKLLKAVMSAAGEGAGKLAEKTAGVSAEQLKKGLDIEAVKKGLDSVKASEQAGYQKAHETGGGYSPAGQQKILASVTQTLPKGGDPAKMTIADVKEAPKTYAAIGDLKEDFSRGNTDVMNLEKHRRLFNNIIYDSSASATDKGIAGNAIKAIDKHINEDMKASDFNNGGRETADAIKEARAHSAKRFKLEALYKIAEANDGDPKAIAKGVKSWLKARNGKNQYGLKPDEIKTLKTVAKGTGVNDFLGLVAKLAGSHVGISPALAMGAVGLAKGGLEAGTLMAGATKAAGMAGRGAGGRLKEAQIAKMFETLQGRPVEKAPIRPSSVKQLTYQPGGTQIHAPPTKHLTPTQIAQIKKLMKKTGGYAPGYPSMPDPSGPSTIYQDFKE